MLTEYFQSATEAIEFARAHAGVTIVVPIMPTIERIALEGQICKEIARDPSSQTASRLAALHNIQRRTISKTVKRITGVGVADRRQHCRHSRITGRVSFRI